MTRRDVLALLAGAGGAVMVGGCWPLFASERLRYRVTVEVETPQGVRRGSSVIETTINDGMKFGDASGISSDLKGEAVAVDLPGGRSLFALLRSEANDDAAAYHANLINESLASGVISATPPMPRQFEPWEWADERRALRRLKPSLPLSNSHYPLLVTFRDIRDPKSVERVDPAALDKSFGAGVTLRRITVTVTDDSVTTGIEERLGWLGKYRNLSFAGNRYPIDSSLPDTLMAGAFTTETVE